MEYFSQWDFVCQSGYYGYTIKKTLLDKYITLTLNQVKENELTYLSEHTRTDQDNHV